jgi:hypothetical protein
VNWHDLEKTRVKDLRAKAKELMPDLTGVIAMKKEELIEKIAANLGIEHPHKRVVGIDKQKVRDKIKALKVKRQAALEAHDGEELKKQRRLIHRQKRRLRRAIAIQ